MEKENKIQLENIVYYRGETHYFVMTALRPSLIERGVILEDKDDRKALMAPSNINRDKLHQVKDWQQVFCSARGAWCNG